LLESGLVEILLQRLVEERCAHMGRRRVRGWRVQRVVALREPPRAASTPPRRAHPLPAGICPD
jgi:hypothetical protein